MKTPTRRSKLVSTFEYLPAPQSGDPVLVEIYQLQNGPFHYKILHVTLDNTRRVIAEGMESAMTEEDAIEQAQGQFEKLWKLSANDFEDTEIVPCEI